MTTKKTTPRWLKKLGRRLTRNRVSVEVAAMMMNGYFRLVHATNPVSRHPDDLVENTLANMPVIIAMWHGQHFMLPLVRPRDLPLAALVSRAGDGELNSRVLNKQNVSTIRGSGGRDRAKTVEKGGVSGLMQMTKTLQRNTSIALIADIAHGTPRLCSMGIIALAQISGRPILPLAYCSSRRHIFRNSWDRAALNLPFGKAALCGGELIKVPRRANQARLEKARLEVEDGLNKVTRRAAEMVGAVYD